ncbi:MAG: hypothetical protein MPJ25_16415, partial [Pirellulales bacterium]|nr:hypothetical protein [Pirellulales bacterium]
MCIRDSNTNEVRGTVDVSGIAGDDISVNSVDITNPNFLNDTTSTSTTRGVTFAVTNTNEIRGTVDVSGLDEEAVVILTTTGQDVPPNGVAYVSSTEQYWNVSGSGQTGVTTTTDFTAQDTWRRIVDITNLENQVQDLENHPKGITRIEDATDYPRASTVSYGADYWNATRRSEIQTLDFGVRFLVGSRHLLVNNNNVNFTGLSVGDVLSVRTGFVDSDNPGTEIARFRVGSVQGRAARFDALDDATVTFLFNNRDTANSDSSTYFFTASQRNTIFAGWHEETASHPTDVLLTRQADNTVGTRSIGGTDPNNIATLSDAISPVSYTHL